MQRQTSYDVHSTENMTTMIDTEKYTTFDPTQRQYRQATVDANVASGMAVAHKPHCNLCKDGQDSNEEWQPR
jgi:hypothetical protein